jgi:hypothetical protein
MKSPSMTQVKQVLRDSQFDPRQAGPMKFVVESNDPTYCTRKATELIGQADLAYGQGQVTDYHERLAQAISLLALARLQRGTSTA